MHELSIAQQVIETLEHNLLTHEAERVVSVTVEIGALCGVEAEPFDFCFPLAAQGTRVEGARLILQKVPLRLRCALCKWEGNSEIPLMMCEQCGAIQVDVLSGRDFIIKTMEVQ